MTAPLNVLFLCAGNSARSILAETYLNHKGAGRFRAFSAGSQPTGRVNPNAAAALKAAGIATPSARSKSWDEFAGRGAPQMDLIITVCASASGETCPIWPGHPATAHWGLPDPAATKGSPAEIRDSFEAVFITIGRLIDALVREPPVALAPPKRRETLERIGREILA
jgi:arsenate reductase